MSSSIESSELLITQLGYPCLIDIKPVQSKYPLTKSHFNESSIESGKDTTGQCKCLSTSSTIFGESKVKDNLKDFEFLDKTAQTLELIAQNYINSLIDKCKTKRGDELLTEIRDLKIKRTLC